MTVALPYWLAGTERSVRFIWGTCVHFCLLEACLCIQSAVAAVAVGKRGQFERDWGALRKGLEQNKFTLTQNTHATLTRNAATRGKAEAECQSVAVFSIEQINERRKHSFRTAVLFEEYSLQLCCACCLLLLKCISSNCGVVLLYVYKWHAYQSFNNYICTWLVLLIY
jgi:hypothetical protein